MRVHYTVDGQLQRLNFEVIYDEQNFPPKTLRHTLITKAPRGLVEEIVDLEFESFDPETEANIYRVVGRRPAPPKKKPRHHSYRLHK